MSTAQATSIESVRRMMHEAACESYLDDLDDDGKVRYLTEVAKIIDSFLDEYQKRFGKNPDPFELLEENRDKGVSFIQWITGESLSVGMAIMIWRVLSGAEILSLRYSYKKDNLSELEIEIEPMRGERLTTEREIYTSDNPLDFHLLAEFRMLLSMHKPYLIASFPPIR